MEFTQPLGVGLGLVVRINNQHSHPVCTGRRTDAYAIINTTWEISWETSYLLGNIDVEIHEFAGTEYCVDDVQMMQTDELQMMMSCGSHTSQLHKSIAKTNCTK